MAVRSDEFPANLSDRTLLLQSLLTISQEISAVEPMRILLRKSYAFVIREARLFSILFEELVQDLPVNAFPNSAVLCFEEMHMVMRRIKVLLQDCSACSRMWLLMQVPSISNSFHRLIAELSTLLDIFPAKEIGMSEDLEELLNLIRKQCCYVTSAEFVDPRDSQLRTDVLKMLDDIKRKIVPDHAKLSAIFDNLNLIDSESCTAEILNLEGQVQNQQDRAIALIGLVRYAKCVLYGTSTSGNHAPPPPPSRQRSISEVDVPSDFRCPISLDLMRDPVVVSTGQTYDRSSISTWIQSGHATCPKTGQALAHTQLIPNLKFKNLVATWCRDQNIPFDATDLAVKQNGILQNTAALEVTKMTAAFLVGKLEAAQTDESAQRLVSELRAMSKTDSDSRACIVNAGALPPLVKFLGSRNPTLQIDAVTTVLNLSILEPNKRRILETDGVVSGVVEVLTSGSTWEAKGNAAATVFSLTAVHACRKNLGKKKRVIKGLFHLARLGPTNSKRDAMMAILNLAGDREAASKLIEAGAADLIGELLEPHPEEAAEILEAIAKRGGLPAICAICQAGLVKKLADVMRDGTDRARESAAAALVNVCRKGGSEMAAELAAAEGIERAVWEIMGTGTERARRKANTLLRILRIWSTGAAVPSPAPADNFIRQSTTTRRHVMAA
ncbi:hypothetical protein M569_14024 [Genlisea aurea]|uniref:RING-type E3 ubiquitin transferase n=1 Tax=Genlisea aurea TaxID=192259 RepID=S8C8R3_9LAMI|nr:hypothetical protein M569_14024 [Genlisea aurea]